MRALLKKRISVQMAVVIAALVSLSSFALAAVTITQTQRNYEAISGGMMRVTNSILVTDYAPVNMVGESLGPTGTDINSPVLFSGAWPFCAEVTPNGFADGDFGVEWGLSLTESTPANTVFHIHVVVAENGALGPNGDLYVKTPAKPYADGICVGVIAGLGTSFTTPLMYRLTIETVS